MIADTIREQMARTIKYVEPIRYGSATGLTAELYDQMQAEFLPVPPITLHSPAPQVMAGVWSMLRETLHTGYVDRSMKEAIAATVSKTNECPYCVDVHTLMLHGTSEHDAASAILRSDYETIHDPQLHAIVHWVLTNRTPGANAAKPPFSANHAPEMIGTVVAFNYINRMVNVFLGETFIPLPTSFKGLTGRLFGATAGKRFVHRTIQPGDSLKFLPPAQLPDDLAWAASNPAIASAFAGFAKIVEDEGNAVLPEQVRSLVSRRIEAWKGEAMGLSRRWVEDAIIEIDEAYRSGARLALLTALASYQVDSSVIEAFRSQYPEDAQLIAATAWASFTAARHIGVWFAEPFKMSERVS